MNYRSDIATNSYTSVIEVKSAPRLPVNIVKVQIYVGKRGRGPKPEYYATIHKTYSHHIVNDNKRQKLYLLKRSKESGEYFFTWKIRIDGVKRKHLKNSDWCFYCNFHQPCKIEKAIQLEGRSWNEVEHKIVKIVNEAKRRNPHASILWDLEPHFDTII